VDFSGRTKGRFIVATNELDPTKLSAQEMLFNYKEQQAVERGFRFLKDPFFMTSSVFLKPG
jgi:transposase